MLKIVERCAFEECKNLKSIELPDEVEYVGEQCFQESGLESVRIPPALKTIEASTFYQCESLKNVVSPLYLEKIGLFAFGQTGLESVELPGSLRTVSQGAFYLCKNLRVVKFNEGIEAIGTDEYSDSNEMWVGAFQESTLENVELPSTLKRIEYNTFQGCENLKNILFPRQLEHIGVCSFSESGLSNVVFPKSLRTVSQGAFSRCGNLKTVVLNDGLEVLGSEEYLNGSKVITGVFESSALESVKLSETLKRIGTRAFAGCKNLKRI